MNSIYERIFGSIDDEDTTIEENKEFNASLDDLFCFANEDNSEFNRKYMNSTILTEAPGDENQGGGNQTPPENQNANAEDDDNFDIDTELDDEEGNNETDPDTDNTDDTDTGDSMEDGIDDTGEGDEDPDDKSHSDSNQGNKADESNDEDAVQDNEDIFFSLTAEEQQIKIMELKKQYSELFNACDDILDKINDLELSELDIHTISKVSNTLYNLKSYISDYLYNQFPDKSYFENDVAYNSFLSAFSSVKAVMGKLADQIERERKEEEKEHKSDDNDIDEYLM